MSLEITRGYLRARLIIVLIAFFVALTAGTAFMLYMLEQEKAKVRFGAALGTMAELSSDLLNSSAKLENSAQIYSLSMNAAGHGSKQENLAANRLVELEAAKGDFSDRIRRLTHLFHALQWSADGDITVGESERLTAEETGDALYKPDAALSSIVRHIEGRRMPDAIRPMWAGNEQINLKRDIGEVISLSNRLDLYRDLTGSTAKRTFLQLNNLADERIKPGLSLTLDRLHADMIVSYFDLQKMLGTSATAMAVFSLIIAIMVLLPMARRIAESHQQLSDTNEKFEAALERAESSDRAKSEFLANMSHEIRTPMNGVLGMAELLAKTDLDTRQQTFTEVIVKSGNALLTIINDILDFSKIDAGQLELDPAPFRLSEAVEDVAALVSAHVAEKDLELIVRIDPGLPTHVVGDIGRLRQILTNMLGNAVKFTEQGHVLINVSGRDMTETAGGGKNVELTFSVEDTGVGIPEDKLRAVFEKFAQVDSSSTRRHEGTGLGLAIATRLVRLMGGELQLKSSVGEGTTFWFDVQLPVHKARSTEKALPVDVSDARILIVDDNAVNREILIEQLASWNFDCSAAASGAEGLQKLADGLADGSPIDCVILDYQMPEMNGEQVARAIRDDTETEAIPIILLTSVDQADFNRFISDTRISACLTKPARASALFDTLIGVLQTDRQGRHASHSDDVETPAGPINQGDEPVAAFADEPEESLIDDTAHITPEAAPEAFIDSESEPETSNRLAAEDAPAGAEDEPSMTAGRLAAMAARMRQERDDTPETAASTDRTTKDRPPFDERLDVLVAEDNEVNQMVFTEILDGTGLNYLIVGNGKRAVDLHTKRKPGIILMDVSMPEMNGLEATRTIREVESDSPDRHTPIIGVTAHALKGDRERCINAGMDDYVTKPVSPEKLGDVIDRWLHKKGKALAS